LNLSIVHTLYLHIIEEAKQEIIQSIEEEPHIIPHVQLNILALIQTKIPRERIKARETLENIVQESPNHLNALADLEHIYRELHRMSDAERCRKTVSDILKGDNPDYMNSRFISLLEQAYAIRMERTLINENIVHVRVTDLQKIIWREFKHSNGARRKCLGRSLNCSKHMLRKFDDANKHITSKREQVIRSSLSVNKFETANELFPDHVLHPAWRFNYAKSLNQYCDIVEQQSKLDNLDKADGLKTITLKASWFVLENHKRIYVCRYESLCGQIIRLYW
jgi:hypothetical protein